MKKPPKSPRPDNRVLAERKRARKQAERSQNVEVQWRKAVAGPDGAKVAGR
jgi:hypothetical protein